jgi:hypothetical protein
VVQLRWSDPFPGENETPELPGPDETPFVAIVQRVLALAASDDIHAGQVGIEPVVAADIGDVLVLPDNPKVVIGLNAAREMARQFVADGIARLAEKHPECHSYAVVETAPPGVDHLARAEHTTPCLACARAAGPGTVFVKHG